MPVNLCTTAREKRLHRVLGCLTVLANDKAVYSVDLSRKTEEWYTLEATSRQTQPTEQSPYMLIGPSR